MMVVGVGLSALAWMPASGLAQQDQGKGNEGKSGDQKQTEKEKGAGGGRSAPQGSRQAPQPKAGGRQQAPPPKAPGRQQAAPGRTAPQSPPASGKNAAPPQKKKRTAGGRTAAQSKQPQTSGRPQAGTGNRNPYALYQTAPASQGTQPNAKGRTGRRASGAPTARTQTPAQQGARVTKTQQPAIARPMPAQRPSRALAGLPPAVPTTPPGPVSRQALTRKVATPSFRGQQAERTVRTITPQVHQQEATRFTSWIKKQNSAAPAYRGRPTRDLIGNPIPAGTRVVDAAALTQININFVHIENDFGPPRNTFMILPRTTFYAGFFTQNDGFLAYQRFGHHSVVAVSLFYPFYFSDPYWHAFSYPGFYPSVYSMYGWSPGWVYPDRVYYQPEEYVYAPVYLPGGRLDAAGEERAINDIRHAWIEDDPTLFSTHLTQQIDVRIYFSGEYSYSSAMNDYNAMTADTMSTNRTTAMDFQDPVWISSREVFYTGRQVFQDPDGDEHTLYVSYRLRKLGPEWYIVAFGSSPDPIQSHYTDFRNN
jgi:hypothetical protein